LILPLYFFPRVPHTPSLRVVPLTLIHTTANRLRSKPIRENQLDQPRNPAGI